jgi:hypothetical protein
MWSYVMILFMEDVEESSVTWRSLGALEHPSPKWYIKMLPARFKLAHRYLYLQVQWLCRRSVLLELSVIKPFVMVLGESVVLEPGRDTIAQSLLYMPLLFLAMFQDIWYISQISITNCSVGSVDCFRTRTPGEQNLLGKYKS